MAKLKDFYKIIPGGSMARKGGPVSPGAPGDAFATLYQNFSWYAAALKGVTARFQRYKVYDQMDRDADISRSLDTMADEMTPNAADNMALPFEIKFNIPESEEADESMVVTLRHQLQRFGSHHRLDVRLWNICRQTIKYGDCFFQKIRDHQSGKIVWRYIDQNMILGILLDENSREPVYYQLKLEKTAEKFRGNTQKDTIFIPATKIVHFSLGSEMNATAPFGESILQRIFRVWRQLQLLEDSIIIYRVVRAPERRVFYIDVGKMSPIKSKQYLDRIKTEIKQKRIPSSDGGTNKMDSIYDAASMQEDFYIAQTADGRGSKIETLPAGQNLGELEDLHFFQEKLFRGLRIPVSYMVNTRGEQGATTGDGKVGTAYIAELRFVRLVMRLQEFLDHIFDAEFKDFLRKDGIIFDENSFELKLPEPENFGIYRTSELSGQLFQNFSSAEGIPYLSKRFILKKFLNFNDDDMQVNEILWKQEHGITGAKMIPIMDPVTGDESGDNKEITEIQLVYDPKLQDE